MKNKTILGLVAAIAIVMGYLWFANSATTPNEGCVTVYVDFGVLDHNSTATKCVAIDGAKAKALDVLSLAGYKLEGTTKYGSQIVCRVNALPSATTPIGIKGHETYTESCKDMPAEFAYWAVLVKKSNKNQLDVTSKWGWAQTGIDQVVLNRGDSIGLVFADNDNVRFPN